MHYAAGAFDMWPALPGVAISPILDRLEGRRDCAAFAAWFCLMTNERPRLRFSGAVFLKKYHRHPARSAQSGFGQFGRLDVIIGNARA